MSARKAEATSPRKLEAEAPLKVVVAITRPEGKDPVLAVSGKPPEIHVSKPGFAREVHWVLAERSALKPAEVLVIHTKDPSTLPGEPQPGKNWIKEHAFVNQHFVRTAKSAVPCSGTVRSELNLSPGTHCWAYSVTLLRPDGPPVSLDPWIIIQQP